MEEDLIYETEEEQLSAEPSIGPANYGETQIIGENQENQNIKVVAINGTEEEQLSKEPSINLLMSVKHR